MYTTGLSAKIFGLNIKVKCFLPINTVRRLEEL
jgi:hypothetical protein